MTDSADGGYQLRTATPDDTLPVLTMVQLGFGEDAVLADDNGILAGDHWVLSRYEPDRSHLATWHDEIVGHAGAYSAELSVPGATVPTAHVTMVAVAAEHRRRGLLTRLMRRQLAEVAARGEPLAVLWASEGRIYQRYGYGLATRNVRFAADSREATFRHPPAGTGRLCTSAPGDVADQLRAVYQQVAPHRPGWSSRSDGWWRARLADPERRRDGACAARATLHHTAAGVDGYALWRMKPSWDHGGPAGEVIVIEVVAETTEATTALWQHLLTMDLTRTLRTTHGAVHEPLWYLLDDPRRLRAIFGDGLWLRVVDVPGALAARRYAAPIDLVIEVTDAVLPANAGRYRLRAGADGVASCQPTGDPADLACDVADLAAVYLGGTPLGRLVTAGRVTELRQGAVRVAGAAFGWHCDPGSLETF